MVPLTYVRGSVRSTFVVLRIREDVFVPLEVGLNHERVISRWRPSSLKRPHLFPFRAGTRRGEGEAARAATGGAAPARTPAPTRIPV